VADLFQSQTHVNGEIWDATDANRIEQGIESLDIELDNQTDRIDALYAAGGPGGGGGQILSGPSSSRPAPAIGTLYLDLTLNKVICGFGDSWRGVDGSALTDSGGNPQPGTGSAPVLSGTVTSGGSIGAINLSWTAVSGATSYKIYETESPNGVSGATALTTTSSTRTPSTARNYEYWVTATVNGIESAASNHVQATLPFVAGGGGGGGGGTASNPSTALNINGLGNAQGGWWNLGVGLSSGHTDIDPTALKTYVNSPYYTMSPDATAVQFQVYMNGGKTSANTSYPRCELREYATGSTSTKATWNAASGQHVMRGKTKVMHYAPIKCEVCVAQIHDDADDNLQIRAEASSATGAQTWRLSINGTEVKDLISGVSLGQEVAWEIALNNGVLTTKINGSTVDTRTPGYSSKNAYYFKTGDYPQQNSTSQANASTEYSRIELRDLFVSHS
jgi:hypothetical protein